MNKNSFVYDNSHARIAEDELKGLVATLRPTQDKLFSEYQDSLYEHPASFIYTPFDTRTFDQINFIIEEKKKLNPALIILAGIGGSHRGAFAVYQALYGAACEVSLNHEGPELVCIDTIDDMSMKILIRRVQNILEARQTVLVIIASKSGTTLEPLVTSSLLIELLKKYYHERYHEYIIVISEPDSPLIRYAHNEKIDHAVVPRQVPGRYSLFTSMGLLPLALAGVSVAELCAGARVADRERPLYTAALLYAHWIRGITIYNTFIFAPRFEGVSSWYCQLISESLGKEGKGIMPVTSVGTTDLHSLLQYYLAGPNLLFTLFLGQKPEPDSFIIKYEGPLLPPAVVNKSIGVIKQAIFESVQESYRDAQRSYVTCIFDKITPFALGSFLYEKMSEVVYLGALMQVNPFDQPNVEAYKKTTLTLLED